ncbi:hypothetical protein BT67DRAFT_224219 [Trichocladium antarcticum]|uniref:Uncharacterized protein n=1 Tax=Trichocladium antarcticum TaxID=1450529 RepID=A0AAN6UCM2_9PEZI|nr:hypothetical protein BT67DRAFT_224219 [Trichocladium antarcticum]
MSRITSKRVEKQLPIPRKSSQKAPGQAPSRARRLAKNKTRNAEAAPETQGQPPVTRARARASALRPDTGKLRNSSEKAGGAALETSPKLRTRTLRSDTRKLRIPSDKAGSAALETSPKLRTRTLQHDLKKLRNSSEKAGSATLETSPKLRASTLRADLRRLSGRAQQSQVRLAPPSDVKPRANTGGGLAGNDGDGTTKSAPKQRSDNLPHGAPTKPESGLSNARKSASSAAPSGRPRKIPRQHKSASGVAAGRTISPTSSSQQVANKPLPAIAELLRNHATACPGTGNQQRQPVSTAGTRKTNALLPAPSVHPTIHTLPQYDAAMFAVKRQGSETTDDEKPVPLKRAMRRTQKLQLALLRGGPP